jgi:hypothetical protein
MTAAISRILASSGGGWSPRSICPRWAAVNPTSCATLRMESPAVVLSTRSVRPNWIACSLISI